MSSTDPRAIYFRGYTLEGEPRDERTTEIYRAGWFLSTPKRPGKANQKAMARRILFREDDLLDDDEAAMIIALIELGAL